MTRIYVIGPTPPHKGGIAHFNARLLQELAPVAQVKAIGWARYPRWFRKSWTDPSQWSSLQIRAEPLLNGASPLSWLRLARQLRDDRPDRLFLHWAHPIATPMYWTLMRLARRVPGLSVELIVHNVLPHERRRLGSLLARLVFSQAHRFVVHSRSEEARLRPWIGDRPIAVAFHPIYDIFHTPAVPSAEALMNELKLRRPVLLFFGFIRPYKGLEVLVRAMPDVLKRHPEATLLIAGEDLGRDGGRVSRLIQDLGLIPNVRWDRRYVPNEQVAAYFAAADVAVFPYLEASQSGALQVAYAFDTPVVATRVGGLSEAVEEGVSGYLCEPGDAASLASALCKALERPISALSVRQYRQRFSWSNYLKILLGTEDLQV